LKDYFIKKIKIEGPISISTYMAENNIAPNKGYYDSLNIIGRKGDFITAPEISQMFGELLGLLITNYWYLCKKPKKPILVDMGGGNGTMMKDCLRAINNVDKNFKNEITPIFIEASNKLILKQKKAIPNSLNFKDLNKVPNKFMGLIANEFFDALPIKQFIKINKNWHERLIDLNPNNNNQLIFTYDKKPTRYLELIPNISSKYKIIEICPSAINFVKEISKKIKAFGGIAIIIDYALQKDDYFGSLQAVKKHKHVDPLSNPGFIDLSARVNFNMIIKTAKELGLRVHGPLKQNEFLKKLGIDLRFQQLIKYNPSKKKQIKEAYIKLMSEKEMGSLFKVIAITRKLSPKPSGF